MAGRVAHVTPAALAALIPLLLALAACGEPAPPTQDASPEVDGTAAAPATDAPATDAPATPSPTALSAELEAALRQLLRGPQVPPSGGAATSWFSAETAGALRSATVDAGGHATVDFVDLRPLIPNASSSAGSTRLLEELNGTVFALPGIRSVEYGMAGSCDLFWEWLQYGCHRVERPAAPAAPAPGGGETGGETGGEPGPGETGGGPHA